MPVVNQKVEKRIMVSLTKGSLQQLDELCEHFGENMTQVFLRALMYLHYETKNSALNKETKKRLTNTKKQKY